MKAFHVKKQYLLFLAGLVWLAAGFNIVRIGFTATDKSWNLLMFISACATFLIFYLVIFRKLIQKHTTRILQNVQTHMHILRFFDGKSYLIMVFMMSFGIALRASHLWPDVCIKCFYSGLGLSLCMAGIGFLTQFVKHVKMSASI